MAKLTKDQIARRMKEVPEWRRRGVEIERTFVFKDFPGAIRFVRAIGKVAEEAWHHPDIDIRWNKVRLALTTHDAGGLTVKDFDLARRFDRLAGSTARC